MKQKHYTPEEAKDIKDDCLSQSTMCCQAQDKVGFLCTRPANHLGPHIACARPSIHKIAVWIEDYSS